MTGVQCTELNSSFTKGKTLQLDSLRNLKYQNYEDESNKTVNSDTSALNRFSRTGSIGYQMKITLPAALLGVSFITSHESVGLLRLQESLNTRQRDNIRDNSTYKQLAVTSPTRNTR